jgi:hypothetical protein
MAMTMAKFNFNDNGNFNKNGYKKQISKTNTEMPILEI